MAVNRKKHAAAAEQRKLPPIVGQLSASVIVTDGVTAFGALGGMIQLELGNSIIASKSDGTTEMQILCVGHLRMLPRVALKLQRNIAGALDMHRENINRMRAQQRPKQKQPPRPVKQEEVEVQEEVA